MTDLSGESGNFTATVKKSPRYIDMDTCIACGLCAEKCPAKTADEFEEGLSKRKAAYLPYAQAVPLKYVIDPERCIYFKNGKCRACEKFCPTGAVNFEDKEEILELQVGSVIMTTGLKTFDPSSIDSYQYRAFPNVLTSLEFERILAAEGPTKGHVVRLSDKEPAQRIAWLQCVGSRDMNQSSNEYCSGVCCMYAIKEALMAKEHVGEACQPSIFYMDMRTSGKDFEKYYTKAEQDGVRFIRSRVHTITQADADGTLQLEYVTDKGELRQEAFDLVVLSVGMEPADSAQEIAENLGIELSPYRFIETPDIAPVSTSRAGVFTAGVAQGCKDIPQSVMEASAAACSAGLELSAARGSAVKEKTFPAEKAIDPQDIRIGVFVCNCGSNIGGVADVPAVAEFAKELPHVAYVEENQFTCSQDTQEKMAQTIKEENLNRVVVAACTPRTHEPLFQETIQSSGLNPYLFEMANIRNQCTWCHAREKDKATEKSKDLVRMAVAKAALLEPIPDLSVDVNTAALVIGGGVAGMTASLSLAGQGFPVTLVERTPELGGAAREVHTTWRGHPVRDYLKDLEKEVADHQGITVLTDSEITDSRGFVGNFQTDVQTPEGPATISHGATLIATGGRATETEEYLYGANPRVSKWHEIEEKPDAVREAKSIAFIQCVGSRDANRPYCSHICCTTSISQAIAIKEQDPEKNVYILYRDIRTPGLKETLYKKARGLGVIFLRYDLDTKPRVQETEQGLEITVFDPILQQDVVIAADLLNLATAIESNPIEHLTSILKLPVNSEGFLMEAHAKLRPVEFANDGLFMCGLAHYPKAMEESIAQAKAAAGRAATILAKPKVHISPLISQIDQDLCIGCGLCVERCPFGAIEPEQVAEGIVRARNIPASCKGCGICAASCPKRAIDMLHYRDAQIEAAIEAAV
ncbi:MAG: FAD-dependent oxidoreductase [Desulfohalobiaceae bacterium]|nr:FAD-dependent oxidoreductase [Desulfohalobiaceae bacterium]